MYEGMIKKDGELLRKVLDPAFVLVHMTGLRQPREEFIRSICDGTLNYSLADHQKIAVSREGEQAKLTGQSVVRAAVFGGGWHTWRLQLKCRLVRKEDGWFIVGAEASTY